MSVEQAYQSGLGGVRELAHEYGPKVHILADPFALGQLARLCSPEVVQPTFNNLVTQLYQHLMTAVLNTSFPTRVVSRPTRMHAVSAAGVFRGAVIDPDVEVVCVDVARAGILPSQVCYDIANTVFEPSGVRQDHLIMARRLDDEGKVVGADIAGVKIGGPVDGRFVLFPDPMGATGGSLAAAMDHYAANYGSAPAAVISMNLIVTPQFILALTTRHPNAEIFALRVDRGRSADDVLAAPLGARWDEESGLTELAYIVPGGGGFGELMNNSYV